MLIFAVLVKPLVTSWTVGTSLRQEHLIIISPDGLGAIASEREDEKRKIESQRYSVHSHIIQRGEIGQDPIFRFSH